MKTIFWIIGVFVLLTASLCGQSGSINNTLGSGGTFKVKSPTSDSLLIVKDNGKVGVGTVNPAEQLEVNGAVKIGTTSQNNQGTVRFRNDTFEGYSSSTWYSLNNEVHLMGPEIAFTSTVRNADFDFVNTLFTIPDTGVYLIVVNVTGYNSGAYTLASGNYDQNGYVYVKKATDPAGVWLLLHDFFSTYTDVNGATTTFKYFSIPVSHSFVRQFNAGDQLEMGAKVISTGSPAGSWGITYAGADVIRIK